MCINGVNIKNKNFCWKVGTLQTNPRKSELLSYLFADCHQDNSPRTYGFSATEREPIKYFTFSTDIYAADSLRKPLFLCNNSKAMPWFHFTCQLLVGSRLFFSEAGAVIPGQAAVEVTKMTTDSERLHSGAQKVKATYLKCGFLQVWKIVWSALSHCSLRECYTAGYKPGPYSSRLLYIVSVLKTCFRKAKLGYVTPGLPK